MRLAIFFVLVGLGAAVPVEYRDRANFGLSSVAQTVQNIFQLPRFLGGERDVDSDVRFGWSSAPEDSLGGTNSGFKFNRGGSDIFTESRDSQWDRPQQQPIPMHHQRGFVNGRQRIPMDPEEPFRQQEILRKKDFDDSSSTETDFIGITGKLFNPMAS